MAPEFSWMRHIIDRADLTDEILPGETIIEIVGEGRVLIEGHGGVSAYSEKCISVKVGYGVAEIRGSNLKLSQMSNAKLIISGEVSLVQLLRRNAP